MIRTKKRFLTVSALIPALLLGVVATTTTGADAANVGPSIAVYRGAGGTGAGQIAAYEKAIGRPVDYALDFQATDTWSNLEWPDWQAKEWQGRTVVLGATGIFPGDYNRNYNGTKVGWAQAANGDYDAHWRTLGQRLVATGQSKAILRGAHEFNGGWFPHRVHPEEAADFVKAWQRWVTIMRAVPGQSFTFDWNPTLGTEWPLYHPEIAYPGDAYVDHIALDVYDGWYNRGWNAGGAQPTTAERDAVWNNMLNGERGLTYWRDFARSHNKKLSLPEWGIRVWTESDGQIHGGGDNASFVNRMAAIIKDPNWLVDYHAFWEHEAAGVTDPDVGRNVAVPAARAAFFAQFSGSGSITPTTSATPAPSTTVTSTTAIPTSTTTTTAKPVTATTLSTSPPLPSPSTGTTGAYITVAVDGSFLGVNALGTGVTSTPRTDSNTQRWTVVPSGSNGSFTIRNEGKNTCLAVGTSALRGQAVALHKCDSGTSQLWTKVTSASGKLALLHVSTGLAMDLKAASSDAPTQLIVWDLHWGANQQFKISTTTNVAPVAVTAGKAMRSAASSNVLDVATNVAGAALIVNADSPRSTQKWTFTAAAGRANAFSIRNNGSSLCLSASKLATRGTAIVQQHCVAEAEQTWILIPSGSGRYFIRHDASGFVIDSPINNNNPGIKMILWDQHGLINQQFVVS